MRGILRLRQVLLVHHCRCSQNKFITVLIFGRKESIFSFILLNLSFDSLAGIYNISIQNITIQMKNAGADAHQPSI